MYDYGIENGLVYMDGQFLKLNIYLLGEKIGAVTEDKQAISKDDFLSTRSSKGCVL